MLSNLARLHLAMVALGHPGGLHVTAFDPQRVEPANVGRQLFSRGDIGVYKSDVLVNRTNAYFGTTWLSFPGRYEVIGTHPQAPTADILITCVDTAATRRKIGVEMLRLLWRTPIYWLDLGNDRDSGQAILTEVREPVVRQTVDSFVGERYASAGYSPAERTDAILPPLWVYNADIFEDTYVEDDRPSCSLAESLQDQSLFINAQMALWGAQILEQLFRHARLTEHGYWINTTPGMPFSVLPVPIRSAEASIAAMLDRKVATNG
jgi:PRTRC genetic system ThiF family protein